MTGNATTAPGGLVVPLQSCAVSLPPTGFSDLSVSVSIGAGCDNMYIAAVATLQYEVASAGGGDGGASLCQCRSLPAADGACSGNQLPITLTPRTAGSTTGNFTGNFTQCIDPANFDPGVRVWL